MGISFLPTPISKIILKSEVCILIYMFDSRNSLNKV